MADELVNVTTAAIARADEALHELKHDPERRRRRERPKGPQIAIVFGDGVDEVEAEPEPSEDQENHQLDVNA